MLTINAELLGKCFVAGAKNLEAKKEWINELNVFPVPDGDTGTNMTMTIMSAASEVANLSNPDMKTLCKVIASGSLRGARGNSGVILSQLLRGFTRVCENYNEIDVVTLSEAIEKAVETAYKAVMKPKEGTILTVARGISEKALSLVNEVDDIEEFVSILFEEGEAVLQTTPDLLPVLKQAGVVDSGGQGLIEVLRGVLDVLKGKEVDYSIEAGKSGGVSSFAKITAETEAEIKFGYCTEFIIVLNKPMTEAEESEFRVFLDNIGDSIVLVADDEITKVHVHTNDPGKAISKALTFGSLSRIKIDNMREEHQEKLFKDAEKLAKEQASLEEKKEEPAERKPFGFISVSAGDGLDEIFKGLQVDYMIKGGQTMNPSTEDMLNAIDKVNAEHIFILPNNGNIIMAANQARDLTEDKTIHVIPSKTIPQGIVAMINFIPERTAEENEATMIEALSTVKTGSVTYAVRDTEIDNVKINKDDFMGIGDKTILSAGTDMDVVIKEMLDKMVDEDSSIITIYYGEDKTEDDANALMSKFNEYYPDCDCEVYYGGQPVYYYLISVE
ncbi:MAG: DAK2 domain-containing protein [Lachnospiraceae bacterium]|nr:DAK2 domain-containing protein [Lachnospiraceae bacterium]